MGRMLIFFGLVMVVVGLILSLSIYIPWLGRLPGDMWIKKDNFSFYFPITTCVLVSIILTLILWLFRR